MNESADRSRNNNNKKNNMAGASASPLPRECIIFQRPMEKTNKQKTNKKNWCYFLCNTLQQGKALSLAEKHFAVWVFSRITGAAILFFRLWLVCKISVRKAIVDIRDFSLKSGMKWLCNKWRHCAETPQPEHTSRSKIWAATSENVPSHMCAHRRFRSDCTNARSDQNLHWT